LPRGSALAVEGGELAEERQEGRAAAEAQMSKTIEERQAEMRERQIRVDLGTPKLPEVKFKGVPTRRAPTAEPRIAKPIVLRPWPRLLTAELAADYAGVSRSTIDEWVSEGKLHPHPLPGIRGRRTLEKIVFEKSELERFLGLRPE
jgi:hypothetical protein